MKTTFLLLFALCFRMIGAGQVISYDDFKGVIPFLQKEDFKNAFEKTRQLLNNTENDSSDLRGLVAYMNIFSAAGMVTLDQMTHKQFLENAEKFVGQRLVMPAHPCIDSASQGFTSLKFVTVKGQLQGTTVVANSKKTSILCFEYFAYLDPPNPTAFIGKNVRCGGTLERVEVNPNGSKV